MALVEDDAEQVDVCFVQMMFGEQRICDAGLSGIDDKQDSVELLSDCLPLSGKVDERQVDEDEGLCVRIAFQKSRRDCLSLYSSSLQAGISKGEDA